MVTVPNTRYGEGSLLGVTFYGDAFHYVLLESGSGGFRISKGGVVPLDPEQVHQQGASYLAKELDHSLKENKITNKHVCLGIPPSDVLVHQLPLPAIPKGELRGAVENSLSALLEEEPLADYVWDFQEISSSLESEKLVLVVSVKRQLIETQLEALTRAGLHPTDIEFHPIAAWNAFRMSLKEKGLAYAILNVEKRSVYLSVFNNDQNTFNRMIHGDIETLLKTLGSSRVPEVQPISIFQESENAKPQPTGESPPPAKDSGSSPVDMMAREIERSLDYAKAHKRAGDFQQIFVASRLEGVGAWVDLLRARLEIPISYIGVTDLIPPEESAKDLIQIFSHQLVVEAGLAIHCSQFPALLPTKHRMRVIQQKRAFVFRRIAGVFVGIAVFLLGASVFYRVYLENQYQAQQKTLEGIQTAIQNIEQVKLQKISIERDQKELDKVSGFRVPMHLIMHAISQTIPEGMVLEGFQFAAETKILELRGKSYYSVKEAELKMSDFMSWLEQLGYLKNLRLGIFERLSAGYAFNLQVEVSDRAADYPPTDLDVSPDDRQPVSQPPSEFPKERAP
jgi:Tfp pilus assembly PilM family ATPase/Tfp pilus assembly protein PilN